MAEFQSVVQPPTAPATGFASTMTIAGDRKTLQEGGTILRGDKKGMQVSSWELRGPTTCDHIRLCCICGEWDGKRGYLYIRDNDSIESNDVNGAGACCSMFTNCCGMAGVDWVQVKYFDRPPYSMKMACAPFPLCCLCYTVRGSRNWSDLSALTVVNSPPSPLFSSFVCCSPSRRSRLLTWHARASACDATHAAWERRW
jgi:hypothetical protein